MPPTTPNTTNISMIFPTKPSTRFPRTHLHAVLNRNLFSFFTNNIYAIAIIAGL